MTSETLASANIPSGLLTLQTVTMPKDTNMNGDIFGGWLVSQMDMAGGIFARNIAQSRSVTVAINSMIFKHPVHIGDVISCFCTLEKQGNTSLTIAIEVWSNVTSPNQMRKVTEGVFIYVAIDEHGKPHSITKNN